MSRLYPMQATAKQDWLGTKTEGPAKCGFEKIQEKESTSQEAQSKKGRKDCLYERD